MQALAGFDVEHRLMQRAFHLAIFDKALAQERIGMRANVFQRVIFAINQINTDFLTVDIAAIWEIFLYLLRVTYAYPAHRNPPGFCFIYETLFLI